MPAKTITVRATKKADLKKNVEKAVKEASKNGFIYVMRGFSDSGIKKSKGVYEIEIEVHT